MEDRSGNKAMGLWFASCATVIVVIWLFLRSCSV